MNAFPTLLYRLPIATKEGIYAGELNFHIHWTKTEVSHRHLLTGLEVTQSLAHKTPNGQPHPNA